MSGMGGASSGWHFLPLLLVPAAAGAYAAGVLRLTRRGDRWPVSARLWFAVALISILIGTGSSLSGRPPGFEQHAVDHLLVVMLAPTALALSAPVTLWLRAGGPHLRRKTVRLLHSRPARVLTSAPVVVLLDVSGLYVYYLTPLFAAAERSPMLHLLVHVHMFLAGGLLSWFVLRRDPGPRRGGLTAQLGVLLAAAAAHDVLAKVMYARLLPHGAGSAAELQSGAQILYYGGDAIELLTATMVMIAWFRRSGRELRRQQRRSASPHAYAAIGN